MTEGIMEDSRLLQLFLSNGSSLGIYEVSIAKDKSLSCTCPGYAARNACKHINFVKSRSKRNGGLYPLTYSERCKEEDLRKSLESPESFREFIIKFGKIEVC